jgi:hypothetical protein
MNLKKFKLGFGPMSQDIIKILGSYTTQNNYPLMVIASRNQVDYNSGYVCNTNTLVESLKAFKNDNLLICRDHCGPYFADLDTGLTLEQALESCKQTIKNDIESGFDLIHIDVSRIKDNQLYYAEVLIDYALSLRNDLYLEFGSEDNAGVDVMSSIGRVDEQLAFLQKYKNNVKFFVTQTGSLTKNNQAGTFDIEFNKRTIKQVHDAGFLFKEHNSDYFTKDDLNKRILAGVDSLNIAPQLGKIQTETLKEFAHTDHWEDFGRHVYGRNYWKRWLPTGITDQALAVLVSGHYCYQGSEYNRIISNIDLEKFKSVLTNKINIIVDNYTQFGINLDSNPITI